jgi:uncharacterized protein
MTNQNADFQNNPPPPESIPGGLTITSPPRNQIWGLWSTIGLGAAIAAVWLICQIVITVVFVLMKIISQPGADITQLVLDIPANGGFLSLVTIVSSVVGLGLIVLFIVIKKNSNLADYLAIKKFNLKSVLFAIGLAVVLVVLEVFVSFGGGDSQFSDYMLKAYTSSSSPVFLWIAVVFIGPLFEEAFFRGFLYKGLAQSVIRVPGAIFLTALVWAAMHASQYGILGLLFIFIVGLGLGILRWRTKSIWNCLLLHFLFNTAAMVQLAILAH